MEENEKIISDNKGNKVDKSKDINFIVMQNFMNDGNAYAIKLKSLADLVGLDEGTLQTYFEKFSAGESSVDEILRKIFESLRKFYTDLPNGLHINADGTKNEKLSALQALEVGIEAYTVNIYMDSDEENKIDILRLDEIMNQDAEEKNYVDISPVIDFALDNKEFFKMSGEKAEYLINNYSLKVISQMNEKAKEYEGVYKELYSPEKYKEVLDARRAAYFGTMAEVRELQDSSLFVTSSEFLNDEEIKKLFNEFSEEHKQEILGNDTELSGKEIIEREKAFLQRFVDAKNKSRFYEKTVQAMRKNGMDFDNPEDKINIYILAYQNYNSGNPEEKRIGERIAQKYHLPSLENEEEYLAQMSAVIKENSSQDIIVSRENFEEVKRYYFDYDIEELPILLNGMEANIEAYGERPLDEDLDRQAFNDDSLKIANNLRKIERNILDIDFTPVDIADFYQNIEDLIPSSPNFENIDKKALLVKTYKHFNKMLEEKNNDKHSLERKRDVVDISFEISQFAKNHRDDFGEYLEFGKLDSQKTNELDDLTAEEKELMSRALAPMVEKAQKKSEYKKAMMQRHIAAIKDAQKSGNIKSEQAHLVELYRVADYYNFTADDIEMFNDMKEIDSKSFNEFVHDKFGSYESLVGTFTGNPPIKSKTGESDFIRALASMTGSKNDKPYLSDMLDLQTRIAYEHTNKGLAQNQSMRGYGIYDIVSRNSYTESRKEVEVVSFVDTNRANRKLYERKVKELSRKKDRTPEEEHQLNEYKEKVASYNEKCSRYAAMRDKKSEIATKKDRVINEVAHEAEEAAKEGFSSILEPIKDAEAENYIESETEELDTSFIEKDGEKIVIVADSERNSAQQPKQIKNEEIDNLYGKTAVTMEVTSEREEISSQINRDEEPKNYYSETREAKLDNAINEVVAPNENLVEQESPKGLKALWQRVKGLFNKNPKLDAGSTSSSGDNGDGLKVPENKMDIYTVSDEVRKNISKAAQQTIAKDEEKKDQNDKNEKDDQDLEDQEMK